MLKRCESWQLSD